MFKQLISEQLRCPSGMIGRYLLPILWNNRNRALNDETLSRLRLQANDRVLDIGFGGGYLIKRMVGKVPAGHVSGVDASPEIVEYCRTRFAPLLEAGDLDLQCATVEALPYPNNRFNKACSVNSLFYWPGFAGGIREIRRVLDPKGHFVLTYTSKEDLDKREFSQRAVRSFKDEEVTDILREEGFHDVFLEHEKDKYRKFSIVTCRA